MANGNVNGEIPAGGTVNGVGKRNKNDTFGGQGSDENEKSHKMVYIKRKFG